MGQEFRWDSTEAVTWTWWPSSQKADLGHLDSLIVFSQSMHFKEKREGSLGHQFCMEWLPLVLCFNLSFHFFHCSSPRWMLFLQVRIAIFKPNFQTVLADIQSTFLGLKVKGTGMLGWQGGCSVPGGVSEPAMELTPHVEEQPSPQEPSAREFPEPQQCAE
jgi:hypothetical protein